MWSKLSLCGANIKNAEETFKTRSFLRGRDANFPVRAELFFDVAGQLFWEGIDLMQLETQKYLNRNSTIVAFVADRATFLQTWPRVLELRDALQTLSGEIETLAAQQSSSDSASSQHVVSKQTLIDALTHDLEDMARTAKAIAQTDEGFEKNFRMPTSHGEQSIVGAAREFLQNATPDAVKTEFIGWGMPPDFLTDLTDDIAHYDAVLADKNSARQQSSQSLQELDAKIAASGQVANALNAMIKNIYHADPATLVVWEEAKRLRASRAHRDKT